MDKIHTYGVIRCGHIYCFNCIHSWSDQANKCPLCKTKFNVIKKIEAGNDEFVHIKDKEYDIDNEIDPVMFGKLNSERPLLCV